MGTPASMVSETWTKRTRAQHAFRFGPVVPAFNIPETVWNFLDLRMGSDGQPLSCKVFKMVEKPGNWLKCWLLAPDIQQMYVKEGWLPGWHGTRFECLHSILYESQIEASWSRKLGHRNLKNGPGIYCHKHDNRHKSEAYMKHIDLRGDGI